ncbi:hypothetical protein HMPREF0281_00177 [Corynebacterium ammoniagenes DSM 20306]|uniref:Uncharacterized protein n=1 Tax=Corynebacterium ammoniagenes DSM 20306 TaxID=649754 RepID=A0ABP2IGY5_CORAM|nr:hypothetical protein HMPREF0281_00177 [Corynebacterium ammoniagenes DSM 20306]
MDAVAVVAQATVQAADNQVEHQVDSAVVQVDAADVAAVLQVHSAVQAAHHDAVRSRSVRSGMNTRSYAHQT